MSFSALYGLPAGMQGDGEAMAGSFHSEQNYPTSFTPLNARQPPMQYVNPAETLHYPEHTSSIFDIPSDDASLNEVPSKPPKKGKKRPSAQTKKGRAVSLGAVWNYTDEEDVEEFVVSKPTKRAKSTPAKNGKGNKASYRAKSLKADDGDAFEAFDVVEAPGEEESVNSQLTMPPDSVKRKTKKGGFAATKTKKGRLPSFRNLTITKPISPQDEKKSDAQRVISYQGWTSTQDAAKYNGLAQTTLDKLAAFRYNPKPTIFAPSNTQKTQDSQALGQAETEEHDPVLTSLDENNGDLFTQAAWNPEINGPFLTRPALEHSVRDKVPSSFDQEIAANETEAEESSLFTVEHTALHSDGGIAHSTASGPQIVEDQYQYHQSREPASSEAMNPDIPKDVVNVDTESGELQGDMSTLSAIVREARGFVQKQVAKGSGTNMIEVNPVPNEEPVPQLPVDLEFDEFDEGLDDDDLIAISTDKLALNAARVAVLPAAIVSTSSASKITLDIDKPDAQNLLIRIDSDDDEYMMDAGEDDQIHELLKHPDLVIENYHAPTSLQNEMDFQEEYDSSLQFSPPPALGAKTQPSANHHSDPISPTRILGTDSQDEFEDWAFMNPELNDVLRKAELQYPPTTVVLSQSQVTNIPKSPATKTNSKTAATIMDDSDEYEPLEQFVRPEFPEIVRDRCPIVGVSPQSFIRTCFRVGELFKESQKCRVAGQDAIIELFARVSFSSRDAGTQQFRFMDLWSDYPPFPTGILSNYRISSLADSESFVLAGEIGKGKMVRCLGRVRRERKCDKGWVIDIINIRETDWEEIRWTKRIVTAGSERTGLSKL